MSNEKVGTSIEILQRFEQGEETAAEELFARYVSRLTMLARSRLSPRLASRTDPDDVVMSAYRSFFLGARDGKFQLNRSGDLWRLLVSITLHKLYRQVRRHTAEKRSVSSEQSLSWTKEEDLPWLREPSPEEAVTLADELEQLMSSLDSTERRVLELRLQNEPSSMIAEDLQCSERTVRRIVKKIQEELESRSPSMDVPRIPEQLSKQMESPSQADTGAPLAYREFVLHEMIGAGRMGRVYRATWTPRKEQVAIKYLRKSFLEYPEAIERFVQEANLVAQFQHPGIVGIYGLGRAPGGGYFIAMQWIRGSDLSSVQNVELADAVDWMIQATEAIEHAHSREIIHCDLKPANLLLDEEGRIHVTDFGLARSLTEEGRGVDRIEGTAAFMAPEQVSSWWGILSARTDVYGLGAVLYWLLTSRPPHSGSTLADILSRVVSGVEIQSPRSSRDVPDDLESLCLRCLARNPDERFESMSELRLALTRCREQV